MVFTASNKNIAAPSKPLRWNLKALNTFLTINLQKLRTRRRAAHENSPWWDFIHSAKKNLPGQINDFITGKYRFEPMVTYHMPDETMLVWQYADRLFLKALLYIIKPTFKHILSSKCFHMQGPSGVKSALAWVQRGLENNSFRYFLSIDIKGYYASIDRQILLQQTQSYFNDPRILHYLENIINIPIIDNAAIHTPTKGIARRSSLSPLFGAIYLLGLDNCFAKTEGICYARYMDDIVILATSKRKFISAKKKLAKVIASLKLTYSRRKTKMGALTKGFHFLGVNFKTNSLASQAMNKEIAAQTQSSKIHVDLTLHERSCIRALDKVIAMMEDAVHPAKAQQYLSRWATWWNRVSPLILRSNCLKRWIKRTKTSHPDLVWLASGIHCYYSLNCV